MYCIYDIVIDRHGIIDMLDAYDITNEGGK